MLADYKLGLDYRFYSSLSSTNNTVLTPELWFRLTTSVLSQYPTIVYYCRVRLDNPAYRMFYCSTVVLPNDRGRREATTRAPQRKMSGGGCRIERETFPLRKGEI